MAFWSEVGSARAAEDREVQVEAVQGFGCCPYVRTPVATSLKGYFREKFRADARGEPGTTNVSGPFHRQASVGRNLCLRAAGASRISVPWKEYTYIYWSLDSITLAPLVNIGFESNPFPIIIHA